MARYELGAVYKIKAGNEIEYYVRLLDGDMYGVFAPFDGKPKEDIFSKTPYRLYFACNSFGVRRGIWEKVLSSPDPKNVERWQVPDLANFGNFNIPLFFLQHRIFRKGNLYNCDKKQFIDLVKSGWIQNIFDRHENIPGFLIKYYEGWPDSYILDKVFLQTGTPEHQKEQVEVLTEMGFNTTWLQQK